MANTILPLLSIGEIVMFSVFFFNMEIKDWIVAIGKLIHVVFFYKQENNILTFIKTKIIIYLPKNKLNLTKDLLLSWNIFLIRYVFKQGLICHFKKILSFSLLNFFTLSFMSNHTSNLLYFSSFSPFSHSLLPISFFTTSLLNQTHPKWLNLNR